MRLFWVRSSAQLSPPMQSLYDLAVDALTTWLPLFECALSAPHEDSCPLESALSIHSIALCSGQRCILELQPAQELLAGVLRPDVEDYNSAHGM
jgi:hypothetical protein